MAAAVQSRRKFLLALIAGAAAMAGLGRFLKTKPSPKKVVLSAAVSAVPNEGALVFKDERVAIARNGAGFYALSLVCTHLGCTVSVTAEGLFCPCHGSRFDVEGNVMKGPATRPLKMLVVEIKGDSLYVRS